jgi:hypothetical protein
LTKNTTSGKASNSPSAKKGSAICAPTERRSVIVDGIGVHPAIVHHYADFVTHHAQTVQDRRLRQA